MHETVDMHAVQPDQAVPIENLTLDGALQRSSSCRGAIDTTQQLIICPHSPPPRCCVWVGPRMQAELLWNITPPPTIADYIGESQRLPPTLFELFSVPSEA